MLNQANSDPAPTDTGRSRRLVPESNGCIDRQVLLRVASHVSIVRAWFPARCAARTHNEPTVTRAHFLPCVAS